jgi:hypothetical protein
MRKPSRSAMFLAAALATAGCVPGMANNSQLARTVDQSLGPGSFQQLQQFGAARTLGKMRGVWDGRMSCGREDLDIRLVILGGGEPAGFVMIGPSPEVRRSTSGLGELRMTVDRQSGLPELQPSVWHARPVVTPRRFVAWAQPDGSVSGPVEGGGGCTTFVTRRNASPAAIQMLGRAEHNRFAFVQEQMTLVREQQNRAPSPSLPRVRPDSEDDL